MLDPFANTMLALGATGLACGAWAYAAMWPESQIFGPVLVAGHNPREVALTFDDGPNGDTTLRLLDILARHNARATFFLIGRYVQQQPEVARAIARAGHVIGNHTMTHPWLHMQTPARIRAELRECNAVLEDTLGQRIHLFRPPHGSRRPAVLRYAQKLGLLAVNWNVMGQDWKPASPAELAARLERGIARNRLRNRGSNILLHDGGDLTLDQPRWPTLTATDTLLSTFPRRGLRAVTVENWL